MFSYRGLVAPFLRLFRLYQKPEFGRRWKGLKRSEIFVLFLPEVLTITSAVLFLSSPLSFKLLGRVKGGLG